MFYRVIQESKSRYETLYFGSKKECEHYVEYYCRNEKGVFIERVYGYYDAKQKKYYRYGEVYRDKN